METAFQRIFFFINLLFDVETTTKEQKKAFHVANSRSLTSKMSLKGEEYLPAMWWCEEAKVVRKYLAKAKTQNEYFSSIAL